jgi:hypothetical protein
VQPPFLFPGLKWSSRQGGCGRSTSDPTPPIQVSPSHLELDETLVGGLQIAQTTFTMLQAFREPRFLPAGAAGPGPTGLILDFMLLIASPSYRSFTGSSTKDAPPQGPASWPLGIGTGNTSTLEGAGEPTLGLGGPRFGFVALSDGTNVACLARALVQLSGGSAATSS